MQSRLVQQPPHVAVLCERAQMTLKDWLLLWVDETGFSEPPFLPPAQFLSLVLRLARGLAHLHAHNVVHRNIIPESILLLDAPGIVRDPSLHPVVPKLASFANAYGWSVKSLLSSPTRLLTPPLPSPRHHQCLRRKTTFACPTRCRPCPKAGR